MASAYYKPCPELDRCNELIEKYWKTQQYEKCFSGYLALAKQGYPLAECQVGYFYLEGQGVEKDLERALDALKPEDPENAYYATDRRLHELIVNNCGNARLTMILRTLNGQIEQIRRVASRQPQRLRASRREHLDIVAALRARDLERTCQLLTEHIQNVRNATMSVFLLMGGQETWGNR